MHYFQSLQVAFAITLSFCHAVPHATPSGSTNVKSYDYIIVGGGTAGLALASRLTESSDKTVLVLEAGLDPSLLPGYKAPGGSQGILGSVLDWGYATLPQKSMNNRVLKYYSGRCLGGSSTVNGLAYTRGSASIFDEWEGFGNGGWSWKDVYPYFKKSTSFSKNILEDEYRTYDADAYSSNGPIKLNFDGYTNPSSPAFIEALVGTDTVAYVDSLDSGATVGAKQEIKMIDDKFHRSGAYDAYYVASRAKKRRNLTVRTLATVRNILLEKKDGKVAATGVVYADGMTGRTLNVTAKAEVVLSAGALQTPKLMLLSGIGPKKDLEKLKIEVMVPNDNVGQHLQDHSYFGIQARAKPESSVSSTYNDIGALQEAEEEFEKSNSGVLAGTIGLSYAFEDVPDTKLAELGITGLTQNVNASHIEYFYENTFYPIAPAPFESQDAGGSYLTLSAGNMAPISRGSITLASTGWNDAPVIDLNYYNNPTDQKIAIYAFRKMRELFKHPALQKHLVGMDSEIQPGPAVETDEQILKYIRDTATPIWHACGTCRMLPEKDGGVVDERLRVYGVEGLRVVDASIFPKIIDGHPTGAVYMVAEKAADMIKEDAKKR